MATGHDPRNMDSIIDSVAARLNEAVRIEQTRNLLTWTACLTVGEAFEELPPNLHEQAKRELAGRTRRTTRTLSNYLRVYTAVRDLALPNEAMEVLQYSAVLAVLTEYGDERGRQLILDIHDSDLSLMQARVQATIEEIKQARAERKQPPFHRLYAEAIGELGKRIPADGPFNDVEREQLHRALDQLLDGWTEQQPGETTQTHQGNQNELPAIERITAATGNRLPPHNSCEEADC